MKNCSSDENQKSFAKLSTSYRFLTKNQGLFFPVQTGNFSSSNFFPGKMLTRSERKRLWIHNVDYELWEKESEIRQNTNGKDFQHKTVQNSRFPTLLLFSLFRSFWPCQFFATYRSSCKRFSSLRICHRGVKKKVQAVVRKTFSRVSQKIHELNGSKKTKG